MKIALLASGSTGNCALLSHGGTNILIDAGIGPRTLKGRLSPLGLKPEDISHILLTHTHSDHISGLSAIAPRVGKAVVCSYEASRSLEGDFPVLTFSPGEKFLIGDISVKTFGVSHDSPGSCGFVFSAEGTRLGYFTDSGRVLPGMLGALIGCSAAVCECNHDPEMLKNGPYPYYLKQRVSSAEGHLSNRDCGRLLRALWEGGCRKAVLAHLSQTNNRPELALGTVREELGGREMTLACACPSSAVEMEV